MGLINYNISYSSVIIEQKRIPLMHLELEKDCEYEYYYCNGYEPLQRQILTEKYNKYYQEIFNKFSEKIHKYLNKGDAIQIFNAKTKKNICLLFDEEFKEYEFELYNQSILNLIEEQNEL